MSISYTLGIPAANDNPSTDQPNMLANNDNNSAIWAIDHVTFGTNPSGTHKQVTFSSNNVPGAFPAAVNPAVLFTNASSNLVFANTSNAGQYTLGASPGSTVLMGGIIMKWGTGTANSASTFGNAFPNAIFGVTVTGTSSTIIALNVQTQSTTGFTASANANVGFFYIALGY